MIVVALAIWLFIAACVFQVYSRTSRVIPQTAPGGGVPAIAVTSFAWPVLFAIGALALFACFFDVLVTLLSRR